MASPFWSYFADKLHWPQAFAPGPLQAVVRGLAHHFDVAREDMPYLRQQFFPGLCEGALVPEHGLSRSLVRHPRETPERFRQRVVNAYSWHMLGGKAEGLPEILRFYGFDAIRIDSLRQWVPTRWAEFQIGLRSPVTQAEQAALLADLDTLIWLVNEYKPARSRLGRIYTDTYNWYPTIWSEGPAWGEGFWSGFSGVFVPGSDGIVVSLGMPYRVQSERYGAEPGLGVESLRGALIPYVDRPIWSRSNWSELYPMNTGFTVGELLSLHWCEKIVVSHPWEGGWDRRHWCEFSSWDRILPSWSMADLAWCRAQAVQSWPGAQLSDGRDGAYGDINACYSVPVAIISGPPPHWGDFAYSEEDRQRRELRILEQFHETACFTAPVVEPSELAGFGRVMESRRGFLAPYIDHPAWSRCGWSDVFPRNHSMMIDALARFQFCDRVLAPQGWTGRWDARHWAETVGWDRPLPEWRMADLAWCRSQAVHSWPGAQLSDGRDGAYGDVNACYSVPVAVVSGLPPRWGEAAYSEDDPGRQTLNITERRRDGLAFGIEAVAPHAPGLTAHGFLVTATPHKYDELWHGTWDSGRKWWNYYAQSTVTTEQA